MRSILCLDIGSGTQDALLFLADEQLENCPKFVLPAPAKMVGRRIRELTVQGRPIYLHGRNMGGGFYRDLKSHLESGYRAAVHPEAALALVDDPARLESMGIAVTPDRPAGHVPVHLADFDPGFWRGFLGQAGLSYPDLVLAAAQDHGFHPGKSNRLGRFALWESFLRQGQGHVEALVYERVPEPLTRLRTLQSDVGGGLVSDTGAAAALGVLSDPTVEERSQREGVCIVNMGNSHTLAFLVYKDRVYGVYEHHTGLLDAAKLMGQLERFRAGLLSNHDVFADQGHGCLILDPPAEARGFVPTFVIGPRRSVLSGADVQFTAPGGDMMLAGCHGLLRAWQSRQEGA